MVHVICYLQSADCQLNIHVAFYLAAALAVRKFLGGLRDHREAVVLQPVNQRPDRRVFLVIQQRGVVERAKHLAAPHEFLTEEFVVDVELQCLGSRVKIRPVDEERQALISVEHNILS